MEETNPVWTIRHDHVSWTSTDDGDIVILNMTDSRYLSLNASAKVLWERLVEGATIDALAEALVNQYGLTKSVATGDADNFVAGLKGRRLVEVVTS